MRPMRIRLRPEAEDYGPANSSARPWLRADRHASPPHRPLTAKWPSPRIRSRPGASRSRTWRRLECILGGLLRSATANAVRAAWNPGRQRGRPTRILRDSGPQPVVQNRGPARPRGRKPSKSGVSAANAAFVAALVEKRRRESRSRILHTRPWRRPMLWTPRSRSSTFWVSRGGGPKHRFWFLTGRTSGGCATRSRT